MLCHLLDQCIVPHTYSYELTTRTFQYYLHVIDQTIDNVKSLRNGHLRLLESESIESLQH